MKDIKLKNFEDWIDFHSLAKMAWDNEYPSSIWTIYLESGEERHYHRYETKTLIVIQRMK